MEPSERKTTEPSPNGSSSARGRASQRRVTAVSLGISAAFHLVLLVLYGMSQTDWHLGVVLPVGETPAAPVQGTRLVRLIEIPPDETVLEPPEEPEPEPDVRHAAPEVSTPVTGPIDPVPIGLRAAEALRVRSADPRLWRPAEPSARDLTEEELLILELTGLLEALNDSLRALGEAERALTDWTVTDENGDRWGVTPGKLHLGKLTLPLPFGFGSNPWQAERAARRAFEDADIRNGAAASIMAEYWKTRIEAIRERRNRERARERADTTKTKPGGRDGNR